MNATNRSLWLATLACLAMAFFAQAPRMGGPLWISWTFFGATLALSGYGGWLGWQGARQQRLPLAWMAPVIHAFIVFSLLAFTYLLLHW